MRDSALLLRCSLGLPSSGMLCSVDWLIKDVSGHPVFLSFKVKAVEGICFETSATDYPATRLPVPEEQKPKTSPTLWFTKKYAGAGGGCRSLPQLNI